MAILPSAKISQVSKVCEVFTRNTTGFMCEGSGKQKLNRSDFPTDSANFEQHLVRADIESPDVAAYRTRAQALSAGRAELLQNLARIDQCCQRLSAAVESMVQMLIEHLRDQLTQLISLKNTLAGDIEESVREVEAALTADETQFQGKYSAFLRRHEPGSLVLFNYRLDTSYIESCRASLFTFTFSEPRVEQLVRFCSCEKQSDQVEVFDLRRETWGPAVHISHTITFDQDSSYTGAGVNRVFCCGAAPETTASICQADYLIDFASGEVKQLSPLHFPRCSPGVLHYEGQLFVLGGKSHAGTQDCEDKLRREVEMLQLSNRRWTRLPDMRTGRDGFSPCVYKACAYICMSNDTSIDILELHTQTFLAPLSIILPDAPRIGTVLITNGDELVIITATNTTTLNLLYPEPKSHTHKLFIGLVSTAVKYGDRVYWVNHQGSYVRASGRNYEVLTLEGTIL